MKLLNVISGVRLFKFGWILPVLLIPLFVAIGLWTVQVYIFGAILGTLLLIVLISWLVSRFDLHYYLLTILAVLLPFSFEVSLSDNLKINIPSEPLLAIALFSIGWEMIRKPGFFKQLFGNENIWVLPFLFSFVITSLFSTIPWVSIKFTMVNASYILVFFLWIKYLMLQDRLNLFPKLILLYSISLFVVFLISIVQFKEYDWNPVTIRGIFRPFYKDNTIFGATTALVASFWMANALKEKILTYKLLSLVWGILFLAGVLLSTSRAAVLSFIVFGIVWIILQLRIRIKQIAFGILSMLLIMGVFHGFFYHLLLENKHQSHNTKSSYMEQIESSGNISSDISNMERLNRWIAGVRMFTDKPITGFGPGTYQFAYIPYQKAAFMSRLTVKDPWHIPENSGGTAHSEYLLVLSEMGILGILSLFIVFGRWFWIAFEEARSHSHRNTIIMIFAVLSTYLFHAFFNNFLSTDKFAFLFWGMAAWMVAHFEFTGYEKPRIL